MGESAGGDANNRCHERFSVVLWSQIVPVTDDGQPLAEVTRCVTRDFSAGGLGLRTAEPLDAGTGLLIIPDGTRGDGLLLFGRVMHCERRDDGWCWSGVRFYTLPPGICEQTWLRRLRPAA